MASTIAARRPSAFPANPTSNPADEEFINRSLLDSLNAQANAEPMLSSDSEGAAISGNPLGPVATATSIDPSSVPYHISMQQAQQSQQLSHPESPSSNNVLPNYLTSPPLSADPFPPTTAPSQQLYNSMNIHSLQPDFQSVSSSEHDALNSQTTLNGFPSAPLRSSGPFNAFNPRARQNTASLRDTSSSFAAPSYPSQDIYVQNSLSQSQQTAPTSFEPIHHPGRYDYGIGAQQSVPSVQTKPTGFSAMDAYRLGLEPPPTQLKAAPPGFLRDAQNALVGQHQQGAQAFQAPHMNGISHPLSHQNPLQPQGHFGSHPPASVGGQGGAQGSSLVGAAAAVQASQQQPQEEISTIFVVGFPDDMSEREFQNMFTFSSGFEAATLKIPNRELTSYGSLSNGQNGRTAGAPTHYAGSNDPYNLVTVNQGGVVVDGRDGTTSSWASGPMPFGDENHFVPTNVPAQPPRKQIIGFAKFRTREAALDARDVLQGRRVDLEKGSVLKAEMAKKNLHTKRGPGASVPPVTSLLNGASAMQSEGLNSTLNGLHGLGSNGINGEIFSQREKELGALGAMGIAGLQQRRGTLVDERDIGLSGFGTRGARERAEEDERERERKRKEKEATRLRQNTFAFEAFHSVPSQMVRQGANSLLSAESGITNGHSLSAQSSMQSLNSQDGASSMNPWSSLRDIGVSAAQRKMTISSHAPPRPPSADDQVSPIRHEGAPSPPSGAESASGSTNPSAPFSPDSTSSSLPAHSSFQPFGPRPGSPGSENFPTSSSSSANGVGHLNGDDLARAVGALAVSTQQPHQQGNSSPQLPSPSSGTSSSTGRNPGDHNPPINTLYVGNLPTTTSPGGSSAKLEERLRELFTRQTGYRQLCFRHKSNGPMCFVEFEDVTHASRALADLNGDNLGGLIKAGGIRLSYSKNPLGVRTPTSGGNGTSLQQQQQSPQAFSTQSFYGEFDGLRTARRDTVSSGMTSPTSSYFYSGMSSPPPRFSTTSPPAAAFSPISTNNTMFPRATAHGYGLNGPSSFSPFGISPSIPDQPSADSSHDHLTRNMSPAQANVEASRAN